MKEKGKFKLVGFFSPRSAPQGEALSTALDGKQRKIGPRKWPRHHVHCSASIAGAGRLRKDGSIWVVSRLQSLYSLGVRTSESVGESSASVEIRHVAKTYTR